MQLELQLGAMNIFLTPRQMHALILLSNTFLSESTKQQQRQRHHQQRLMAEHGVDPDNNDQSSEYKTFNPMSGNLGMNQCWSSDPSGMHTFVINFIKLNMMI